MPVDITLARQMWDRYDYGRDHGHEDFVNLASRCRKYVAGDQWDSADIALLQRQRRPYLTINKVLSTVSTVMGEQIHNRSEVLFRPMAGASAEVADALSKVWAQISQNNQLTWLRSDVFAAELITGRGYYDVRLDFDDSMRGEVRIDKINPKNVIPDPDADSYDPDGWSDVIVTKWLTLQDIEVLYGKKAATYLESAESPFSWDRDVVEQERDRFGGHEFNYTQMYPDDPDNLRRNIRVIERQYRKLDNQEHFVDVTTGDMRPIPAGWDENRIAALLEKTRGQMTIIKKRVRRIRWTTVAGDFVLHDDWSPYKHFSVVPYFPHFFDGISLGLVENLLSPQDILNKVSSQELHVVNTTANSGWIVEAGSLHTMSIQELEETGSKTGSVIEYNKNTTPPQKIQPNQVPSGLDRISYKAEDHIKTISGVSDSMQGFDREDVAAKAIAYKQQRGAVGLQKMVDNLERTDYLLARNVLDLVQGFYTEPRVISITKDNVGREQEEVEVNTVDEVTGSIINDLTLGEYSIIATTSPYHPSMEDLQFSQAVELRNMGVAAIDDEILIENSRLMRRAEIIKKAAEKAQSPGAQEEMELKKRQAEAEVSKTEAETEATLADAMLKRARAEKEGAPGQPDEKSAVAREKLDLDRWKAEQDVAFKREQFERGDEDRKNAKRAEEIRREAEMYQQQESVE